MQGVFVERTARPVNLVLHDDIIESGIECLVWNFGAYRSVYVLRSYRSIPSIDPDEHVAMWQATLLKLNDLDTDDSESENLTLRYVLYQLN